MDSRLRFPVDGTRRQAEWPRGRGLSGATSMPHEDWFYYYLTGMIGISLVVYLFMRDTCSDAAMHRRQ